MVDSLRASGKSLALVDLGNFLNNEQTVGELKSRFIWQQMEKMGYLASTPGYREMNDWDLYRQLFANSPIHSVASNLKVLRNGAEQPGGDPYMVTEVGGVKVAFFSLISPSEVARSQPKGGLEFRTEDPLKTAQALVPELHKKAELVVLMSQMSQQESEDLITKVPGIDVALYGRDPGWKDHGEKLGSTIVQQTGMRGQYIGQLVLIVDPEGRITDWGTRNAPLDEQFPENTAVSAEIKQIEDQAKQMLRAEQQKKLSDVEGQLASDKMIGGEKCQRCHATQTAQWASTPHAHAYETLVKAGKEKDPACVSCHVTGWETVGGFAENVSEPDMKNVQCEACHGLGTMHSRGSTPLQMVAASANNGFRKHAASAICETCHTGEWGKAKGYDYETYLARVTH